jgi:hypothetical protein
MPLEEKKKMRISYRSIFTDKQCLIEYYDNYQLSLTIHVLYPNEDLVHPYQVESENPLFDLDT